MTRPFEVDGILDVCMRDTAFRARVRAMGGRRYRVRFCCNAGQVRRVLVEQGSHDELMRGQGGDSVLRQIETVAEDREFVAVLSEFSGDKVDIVVDVVGGRVVALPLVCQVP